MWACAVEFLRAHVFLARAASFVNLAVMDDDPARLLEFQDPLIGRILSQRYRVLRMIGRGGMGVVYLAEHILIQRKLAIKVLQSPLAASEELVMRLHREARAAAAVGNEHVVEVTDMGRLDDGTYYIVLEYLEGSNLGDIVAEQSPLALTRVIDIALQICDALAAVHEAGIVHRDLKPENIILIQRGRQTDFVKILDFGICKVFNERPLTATGVALGTPEFMSPEQLEARPEVDARADVYALGSILFFALSGRPPFHADSLPQLLIRIWSDPAPKLRSVRPDAPEALERLVERALAKHPKDRFADAQSLAAALQEVRRSLDAEDRSWALASGVRESPLKTDGDAPKSSSASSLTRAPLRGVRRRAASWAVLALCVAVLLAWMAAIATAVLAPTAKERRPRPAVAAAPKPQPSRMPVALAPEPSPLPTPRRKPKPRAQLPEPRSGESALAAVEPDRNAAVPASDAPSNPMIDETQGVRATTESRPLIEPALVPGPAQLKPVF
jgi:eukaryotic-like serine/threonine-protein kinase